MNDKLLSEAELAAIAERKEIGPHSGYLMRQSCEDISRLLADLHRYRAWCQRLIENEGYDDEEVYRISEEVRAALEGKE